MFVVVKSIHILVLLVLSNLLLQGCIQPTTKVFINKTKATKNTSFSISSVRILNNQLVLTGTNLQDVSQVKLKRSGFDEDFTPESVSATQVIANGTRLITVGVGQVFDLIISNASGAATFQVDFTLSNHSVALSKLAITGATAGQVIKFNGTDWAPASLTEAQIYLGTWNASNNIGGVPDLSSVSSTPGEYYIASHAGTLNGVSFAIGDWIISDGYQWQKIAASKTSVTSFQGRQGIVTLTPADYVSLINTGTNKITGSSINDLFDVNISSPSNGSVLKYNGSKWVVGTDNTGIAAGSIVNSDISASAAIDQSKIANLTTDLAALQSTTGLAAAVRSVTLTGLSSATGTVSASDTILGAFGRLMGTQSDYVSKSSTGTTVMNGALSFTGIASSISVPTSLILGQTAVTNVEYVTNAIAANGVWDKGGSSSINYTAGNVGVGTTNPQDKLEVGGNLRLNTNSTTTPILKFFGNTSTTNREIGNIQSSWDTSTDASRVSKMSFYGFDSNGNQQVLFDSWAQPGGPRTVLYAGNSSTITAAIASNSAFNVKAGSEVLFQAYHLNTTGSVQINPSQASNDFEVYAQNSTPVIRTVGATGLMGIGNYDPIAPLDIGGSANSGAAPKEMLRFTYNSTYASSIKTTTGGLVGQNKMGFYVMRNSVESNPLMLTDLNVLINPDGNVGVGSVTPTAKLSVASGNSALSSVTMTASNTASTFTTSGSTVLSKGDYVVPTGTPAQARGVATGATGSSFSVYPPFTGSISGETYTTYPAALNVDDGKLFVQGYTGNVGVGTATPNEALSVRGRLSIENSGSTVLDNSPFVIETAADVANLDTTALYLYPRDTHQHRLFFGKSGRGFYTLNFAYVGGFENFPPTISPVGDFTIIANYGASLYLRHNPTSGSFIYPAMGTDDRTSFGYFHFKSNMTDVAAAKAYVFDTTTTRSQGTLLEVRNNGTDKVTVDYDGKLGIGTSSPASLLHVSTPTVGATVAQFQSGSGNCTVIPLSGMACSSDLKLKKDIVEIPHALSKILALRGVTFRWKEQAIDNYRRSLGFIAQEVEKVAPELVRVSDDGFKQVNYANFVAVVSQGVKEFYYTWLDDSKKIKVEMAALKAENIRLKQESERRSLEQDKKISQLAQNLKLLEERLNKALLKK